MIQTGTRDCIGAIEALDCTIDFQQLINACRGSFSGNRAVGDACTEHEGCGDSLYCAQTDECPGRCEFKGAEGTDRQHDRLRGRPVLRSGFMCKQRVDG